MYTTQLGSLIYYCPPPFRNTPLELSGSQNSGESKAGNPRSPKPGQSLPKADYETTAFCHGEVEKRKKLPKKRTHRKAGLASGTSAPEPNLIYVFFFFFHSNYFLPSGLSFKIKGSHAKNVIGYARGASDVSVHTYVCMYVCMCVCRE